jgi:quercetin dioxygenase-like cupin family protein
MALVLLMTGTLAYGAEPLRPALITAEQLNQLTWSTGATGTQQAKIVGDPAKPGMYVVRSKFPPGLRVEPHFHPDERIVTVLSGTVYVSYGEQFDESKMQALPAGSVWTEPANQPHFTWAKDGEALIQVVGNGPSGVIPVRPKQ